MEVDAFISRVIGDVQLLQHQTANTACCGHYRVPYIVQFQHQLNQHTSYTYAYAGKGGEGQGVALQ